MPLMKALIIGATGAVGNDLLQQVLDDPTYGQVDIFVRRPVSIVNPKLNVHVIDFEKPDQWRALVKGDVLFSCLGTTLKQAGGQTPQWRVDHDYQFTFAQIAAENSVPQYSLVSSIGANPKSVNFYTRMKGVLEQEVSALPFAHICILQPPSLIRRNSDRVAERISVKILQACNRIGLLKSLTPMPTEIVAAAMLKLAANGNSGIETLTNQAIASYLR